VLTGFGIPAPVLGGILENANHKIEDANYIFSRRMMPRARRTSERLTMGLAAMWRLAVHIQETAAEPQSVKIKRAGDMLKGGATVNESRAEMDLPKHPEPWADQPVIPQGFAPFGYMTPGGAPSGTPVGPAIGPGGNVNGNNPALNGAQTNAYLDDARLRVIRALTAFGDRHDARRKGAREKSSLALDDIWLIDAEVEAAHDEFHFPLPAAERLVDELSIAIDGAISEGKRRSYSVQQIIFGYAEENYPGVADVFDAVDVESLFEMP
jgi:hypothetical protein